MYTKIDNEGCNKYLCKYTFSKKAELFFLLLEIRLERFYKALEDFNWVLDKEPDNVKALLRRADTREKIGQIKEAHADLQRSVIVDENNKRAKVSRAYFMKLIALKNVV